MIRSGLDMDQQAKLDDLVEALVSINAHLRYFEVSGRLTFREKVDEVVSVMRRRKIIRKMRTLIGESQQIPLHIKNALL